jgi:hypothetical protein
MFVAPGISEIGHAVAETGRAILERRPLFEAAFAFHGGYARTDIINPVSNDAWDLIEVKSTTKLKDEHLQDIAFQAWILEGAGLKIRRCYLCHINNKFVRKGKIDPQKFFTLEDVTASVSEISRNIESQLKTMRRTIGLQAHPEIQIGPHCDSPNTCPMHDHCWSFLPEASVFTLYRGGKKNFQLFQEGIHHLKKIPADFPLTDNQAIQRSTLLADRPHIDRPALAIFLNQIKYPVSFLDFETIGTAIPLFDGVRPYQQLPFQFSLHILNSENAKLEHHQFLAEGMNDPRLEFMRRLCGTLPKAGSVVTYNASFEKGRLKECCDLLPEFQSWFRKVEPRIVDLLPPFRSFHYYHPRQNGSASMKAVLPVVTGKSYQDLDIQEGGTASLEFQRITFGDVSKAERAKVRKQLEDYCCLDTKGMAWIVEKLRCFARDE